jgi:hypothetical protein
MRALAAVLVAIMPLPTMAETVVVSRAPVST